MAIIRTKSKATGGITADEKIRLDAHARKWTDIAMRTGRGDRDAIKRSIVGIYAAAGLKEPRVVIVPSPLVMAFAYGAAAWIWHCRKRGATPAVTAAATFRYPLRSILARPTAAATRDATAAVTSAAATSAAATSAAAAAATDAATRDVTFVATFAAATFAAAAAATDDVTAAVTSAATGAATAATAATAAATRDVMDAATAATDAATRDVTVAATRDVMAAATAAATRDVTDAATDDVTAATAAATRDADQEAVNGAAFACQMIAGEGGLMCANRWGSAYQGGNMWSSWLSYLTAFRDVLGLDLPEHAAFEHYETAAMHSGFRVMHDEFCIVSDLPDVILKDAQHRSHCDDGPSHRWSDGWSLYHVHGVRVPEYVVMRPHEITVEKIDAETNAEVRRVMIDRFGHERYMRECGARVVDSRPADFAMTGLRDAKLLVRDLTDDEPIVMIDLLNSTPEPDGSIKRYMLRVDPAAYGGRASRDCLAAVASTWRYGPDNALLFAQPEDYAPMIET